MLARNQNTPSSGTRIRWTTQERDTLIGKGAKLLLERPRWKPIEIVRHAMYALPAERRRDVISLQAFQKDFDQMVQRSEQMKAEARTSDTRASENEPPIAIDHGVAEQKSAAPLAMPTANTLYEQVASLFAKQVAEHLKDTITEIAQEIKPAEKDAVREVLIDISARVAKLELLMGAFAREWGVKVSEDVSAHNQGNAAESKIEPAQSEPNYDSAPHAGHTPSVMPSRLKMGSILVIGAKGRQIESIKREFSGEPIRLTFAQAGSAKSLHNNAEHVVVMKNFVGHRDTKANPHAILVDGGINQVKDAIRDMIGGL
jgi:hypothetical protein